MNVYLPVANMDGEDHDFDYGMENTGHTDETMDNSIEIDDTIMTQTATQDQRDAANADTREMEEGMTSTVKMAKD